MEHHAPLSGGFYRMALLLRYCELYEKKTLFFIALIRGTCAQSPLKIGQLDQLRPPSAVGGLSGLVNTTQRLSHGTQLPPCRLGLDMGSIGSRSCAMPAVFDISMIAPNSSCTLAGLDAAKSLCSPTSSLRLNRFAV